MLLDDLKQLAKQAELSGCVVGKWVATQDPEIRDVIVSLAQKPGLNLTVALDLIKKHDPALPFKKTSFVVHMRGGCSCPVT